MFQKIINTTLFAGLLLSQAANAQQVRSEAFSLLDLNFPGLQEVKKNVDSGNKEAAAAALLEYYRTRDNVQHPEVNLKKVRISKAEQAMADEALEHKFFAHKGYQPSYFYGEDINWQYWPVQDNELRWQLHRHKWFTPLGKAYQVSKDEKYAKAWLDQYMDWVEKNPYLKIKKAEYELEENRDKKSLAENVRFAWRPLEVSHRLQDQPAQLLYFIGSENFSPAFMSEFVVNYHRHADHILHNYSDRGNHLLFEAQRMIYAGVLFPEYKDAAKWRQSGIEVLNREIVKQVYDDGVQYELDLHYHLASINIFFKALQVAKFNGFESEFPQAYLDTVEKMITAYMNFCFPDYTNPCFSDAKLTKKDQMVKDYNRWLQVFPENEQIRFFATQGKEGKLPAYLSQAFKTSGFYVLRNSWNENANMMVYKAGPQAFWHCQPDNGTFEIWVNGKNLFPDSGSYVYAGNEEVMKWRNWFRQTRAHNTLTLNNENLQTTNSQCILWDEEGDIQTVVTENPSYKDLKHRRSVFYVDGKFYVIVDEAIGTAKGNIDIHYHLAEGKVALDKKKDLVQTQYDGINVTLQCFGPKDMEMIEEEGWRSKTYRQKEERTAVAFQVDKKTDQAVRYITIIYPTVAGEKAPKMSAKFIYKQFEENKLYLQVEINKEKYSLNYSL